MARQKKPKQQTEESEQERIDGATRDSALHDYKELSADYAMKAQTWKDAQEARVVREDDLVKVHAHRPFDDRSAARVAKETAKAIKKEKAALTEKQEAKKALDAAWVTVQSFLGQDAVQPMIPDEEPEAAEDESPVEGAAEE